MARALYLISCHRQLKEQARTDRSSGSSAIYSCFCTPRCCDGRRKAYNNSPVNNVLTPRQMLPAARSRAYTASIRDTQPVLDSASSSAWGSTAVGSSSVDGGGGTPCHNNATEHTASNAILSRARMKRSGHMVHTARLFVLYTKCTQTVRVQCSLSSTRVQSALLLYSPPAFAPRNAHATHDTELQYRESRSMIYCSLSSTLAGSGSKYLLTVSAGTSANLAGNHLGAPSLSTSTERTPS